MISWVALGLEAGLAVLMAVLIVYCIRLNKRLSLLRNQNAEFAEMMAGLHEASERAEQSVQQLKATGLATEKSLRAAIAEATAVRAALTRQMSRQEQQPAPAPPQAPPPQPDAAPSEGGIRTQPGRTKVERDILFGDTESSPARGENEAEAPIRPKTRKEAEETVLQAIRSARVGT